MKILRALVGYLAVIALPFAFAYPLAAIDYDGYVNTTQKQEHVLGSIIETCQTVTTQNNSDSGALMKRVPGDINIEERQLIIVDVFIVIGIVGLVFSTVIWISGDNPKRETFTQDTISKTIAKYPKFNWVICHSPHSPGFDGVEGTDWGYTHHELGISFGRTIGYNLYWARSGTFYRYGDGGFINWAYNGKIHGTDDGGATVHFAKIS